jgi:hypothetical protein
MITTAIEDTDSLVALGRWIGPRQRGEGPWQSPWLLVEELGRHCRIIG